MAIKFNKPTPARAQNRFVRFDQDVDAELLKISQVENIDLAEVIRTFVNVGLDEYRNTKTEQEDK